MSGECGSYKGKGQLIGRLSAATRPARTTLVSRAITLRDSESVCRAHELLSPCGPSAILYLPVFRVALLDLILHLTGEYRATEPQCLLQSPESELGSQSPTTRWTCFPRSKRIIHPRTNPRQLRARYCPLISASYPYMFLNIGPGVIISCLCILLCNMPIPTPSWSRYVEITHDSYT